MDIVNDMMSSNFLTAISKENYARFLRVGKMMIKNEVFLSVFVRRAMDERW